MTESVAPNPRRQGEVSIIARFWQDQAFRRSLLSNPKATIEQEFGFQFSEDVTVQVLEALPNVLYIRLPEKPDEADSTPLEELVVSLTEWEGAAMAQLIAKAWKDDRFKQALLSNPNAVLSQEFGTLMPDRLCVQVLPENPHSFVLVLPVKPDAAIELSDEELETIAGGVTPIAAIAFPFADSASTMGSVPIASIAGGIGSYPHPKSPW